MPFTELADRPATGRVYEEHVRAGIDSVNPAGRVRLDAIARWLQDAAYWDLVDAGDAEPSPWLVRRLRIRVSRWPVFAERLRLATWCSGLGALVAERRSTLVSDAGARVETVAQWVALDPATMRPGKIPDRFLALYGPSAGARRSRTKLHHPGAPPATAARRPFVFRAGDLDPAQHVNNAVYWAALEEELGEHAPTAPLDAEVEHRGAAGAGPAEVRTDGPHRWVVSCGEVVATFAVEM